MSVHCTCMYVYTFSLHSHIRDVDIRHNRLRDEVFDLCCRAYLSVSVEEVMVSPETG